MSSPHSSSFAPNLVRLREKGLASANDETLEAIRKELVWHEQMGGGCAMNSCLAELADQYGGLENAVFAAGAFLRAKDRARKARRDEHD